MGKGDVRTKRGKRIRSSYGKCRPKTKTIRRNTQKNKQAQSS